MKILKKDYFIEIRHVRERIKWFTWMTGYHIVTCLDWCSRWRPQYSMPTVQTQQSNEQQQQQQMRHVSSVYGCSSMTERMRSRLILLLEVSLLLQTGIACYQISGVRARCNWDNDGNSADRDYRTNSWHGTIRPFIDDCTSINKDNNKFVVDVWLKFTKQ